MRKNQTNLVGLVHTQFWFLCAGYLLSRPFRLGSPLLASLVVLFCTPCCSLPSMQSCLQGHLCRCGCDSTLGCFNTERYQVSNEKVGSF